MARKSLRRKLLAGLMGVSILVASCGGEGSTGGSPGGQKGKQPSAMSETTMAKVEDTGKETTAARQTGSDEAAQLARAEIGKREITDMIPADGKKPDAARLLPENPPKGIEVYPATTNASVEGPIDYERHPPTNGDHAPIWQNCGFYEEPIEDRHAVHSLDHGVVWITYRPGLPQQRLEALRPYGKQNYVILSPYPGQDAPVIATSWRVQLELNNADDPRLRRFVNEFKISELAPLSGNRCKLGVGSPKG